MSSTELVDISKMKVAELKKVLKAKGLSIVGTKNELVERLQSAGSQPKHGSLPAFVPDEEDGNAESEILDEDEVLAGVEGTGEFDDEDAEAVLEDEPKEKPEPSKALPIKRPAPLSTETSQEVQPKKRVLVRPISVINSDADGKENNSQEKSEKSETGSQNEIKGEKKVIKLSAVSLKERLELRAQKFGIPLSEDARKQARAERFGVSPTPSNTGSAIASKKVTLSAPSADVLKKRAERFGGNVSTVATKVEELDKLKKRQERFGLTAATAESLDAKKKLRAERFKL